MQTSVNFNHQTVALDGESFTDCEFVACRLTYAGGDVPYFSGCRFDDCEWKHEGAASRTLSYLKLMWGVGEKSAVQTAIKDITVAAR